MLMAQMGLRFEFWGSWRFVPRFFFFFFVFLTSAPDLSLQDHRSERLHRFRVCSLLLLTCRLHSRFSMCSTGHPDRRNNAAQSSSRALPKVLAGRPPLFQQEPKAKLERPQDLKGARQQFRVYRV